MHALRPVFALVLLLAPTACRSVEQRPATQPNDVASKERGLSPLRPLDEAHAAELRRAFDEAKDRPRYIMALSPT
jgi:hypothetical protein